MNSLTLFRAYTQSRDEVARIERRIRWDLAGKEELQIQLDRLARQCRKLDRRLHARLSGHRELGYSCVICGELDCVCRCEQFHAPANYMSTQDIIAQSRAARKQGFSEELMKRNDLLTFTVQNRAFILDRRPVPHSTMLWRVQATDGQVWFGVWHKGFTAPMFFDAPKSFILRDTPQECFREFVHRRGVEFGPGMG